MKHSHDRTRQVVKEPVQVYLARSDRDRLDRLTSQLETTKSDVLRRALEALERELTDPAEHPALRIIGIAGEVGEGTSPEYDVAREHDRFLAEAEPESWRTRRKRGRAR